MPSSSPWSSLWWRWTEPGCTNGRGRATGGLAWSSAWLGRLSFHLSGAQIGITVSSLLLGFMIEPALAPMIEPGVEALFGANTPWGVSVAVALVLATVVQMMMGELVPKAVATTKPFGMAVAVAVPTTVYGVLARPVVAFLNGSANWMVRRLGMEPREEIDAVPDRDELEHLFVSSGEEGMLDEREVRLLTRSIRLADKQADDAMVPRVEVIAIEADASVADLADLAARTGHSRFPVMAGHLDNVAGVVHVKSLFAVPGPERPSTPVSQLMRSVLAVPESRDLDDMLDDLRTGEGPPRGRGRRARRHRRDHHPRGRAGGDRRRDRRRA